MFKIGEFARLNRVSAKLLRHYDEIGIFKPEEIDEYTGYRYYSAAQIPTLNRIIAFKDLGFTLNEISGLLKSNLSSKEMVGILKSRKIQIQIWEELVSHIEKYNAKILAGCFTSYHGEIEGKGVDAEVFEPIDRNIPATDRINVHFMPAVGEMACVVHPGPYENIKLAYAAITRWIEDNGYTIKGNEREIYLKGEWNSKDSSEYITEIQFPVEKM